VKRYIVAAKLSPDDLKELALWLAEGVVAGHLS
jgi:hypothetical protein